MNLYSICHILSPQDLGSIEPGKLADLVVLDKDPLQNIENTITPRYVMKNGELSEGETLNQIWPKQKTAGPYRWWNDHPYWDTSQ